MTKHPNPQIEEKLKELDFYLEAFKRRTTVRYSTNKDFLDSFAEDLKELLSLTNYLVELEDVSNLKSYQVLLNPRNPYVNAIKMDFEDFFNTVIYPNVVELYPRG